MNFIELDIKSEYRSLIDSISTEFLIPTLEISKNYDRAVGFFSSSALIEISKGISGLVKNGGKIRLIASPKLSEEDINSINQGYEQRDKVIANAVENSLEDYEGNSDKARLNILSHLIATNKLEIKIAVTEINNQIGMYHEKLGIITDSDDNTIVFTGSMNETSNAFNNNYEAIDIFKSWTSDNERVISKKEIFEKLWNNQEKNLLVYKFIDFDLKIIEKYKRENIEDDINLILEEDKELYKSIKDIKADRNTPRIPKNVKLHDYQIEAISTWKDNGFRGIFDMATGTGKTFTGLGAIVNLYEDLKHNNYDSRLFVVIVCPYQHLVEQWVEDLKVFNIDTIIGYSASRQKEWKKKLKDSIFNQKMNIKNRGFVCLICTNATFSTEFIQEQIGKVTSKKCILVDEAHNFGSYKLRTTLKESYDFRIGLSATIERHNDEIGTQSLFDFFGEKCIEYSLEQAIEDEKLTKYKYYPVVIYLTEEELEKYIELSEEIKKNMRKNIYGEWELTILGKKYALERAKLIASAENKISALEKVIEVYKQDKNILVYCGAANLLTEDKDGIYESEQRQIDVVTDLLGNKLNMNVAQFTARENIVEREIIKEQFASGDSIQALIAIKCLDEGVNIPQVDKAFILASTTNPKEYIQRRGRVLRLSPNKEYAKIYDFITLPIEAEYINNIKESAYKDLQRLVKNELKRAEEFMNISDNFTEVFSEIRDIKDSYGLLDIDFEEEID